MLEHNSLKHHARNSDARPIRAACEHQRATETPRPDLQAPISRWMTGNSAQWRSAVSQNSALQCRIVSLIRAWILDTSMMRL